MITYTEHYSSEADKLRARNMTYMCEGYATELCWQEYDR